MPKYVTNIIEIHATDDIVSSILEAIKNDKLGIGSIDFNKIIPMPDNIYRGDLGREELLKYGKNNWMDWSVQYWGTKWGPINCIPYENDNMIEFDTAWSMPEPVIRKLSGMFPDVTFTISYADEDIGFNCGQVEYSGGEVTYRDNMTEGSDEAIKFASEVTGYEIEDIHPDSAMEMR